MIYTVQDIDATGKSAISLVGNWPGLVKILIVNSNPIAIRFANSIIDLMTMTPDGLAGGIRVTQQNSPFKMDWTGPLYAVAGDLPAPGGVTVSFSLYASGGNIADSGQAYTNNQAAQGVNGPADPGGQITNQDDPFSDDPEDEVNFFDEPPAELNPNKKPWIGSAPTPAPQSKCVLARPDWWPKSWSW